MSRKTISGASVRMSSSASAPFDAAAAIATRSSSFSSSRKYRLACGSSSTISARATASVICMWICELAHAQVRKLQVDADAPLRAGEIFELVIVAVMKVQPGLGVGQPYSRLGLLHHWRPRRPVVFDQKLEPRPLVPRRKRHFTGTAHARGAVFHGVFNQRLKQQIRHLCASRIGVDLVPNEQPVSKPKLFDSKV